MDIRTILAFAICFVLAACGHNPNVPNSSGTISTSPVSGKPIETVKPFDLDAELLQSCDTKLTNIGNKDRVAFSMEVLSAHKENVAKLGSCSSRHSKLIEVLCSNAPFKGQPGCVDRK